MPRFAPVCPPQIYYGLKRDGMFGDYHLLLAHDVVKHPNDYSLLFGQQPTRDWTVILDNSVVELGDAVDLDMIVEAAKICKPTTTVLPDVMLDTWGTINNCKEALETWSERFIKEGITPRFMFIPQGTTMSDWVTCAEEFKDDERINYWGVPRNVVGTEIQSRVGLPILLNALNPKRRIHLLGFSDEVADDIYAVRVNRDIITGIDSAVPIRAVNQDRDHSIISYNRMPKRGNWWEEATYDPKMAEVLRRVNSWFA